jgi:hypothetical protein
VIAPRQPFSAGPNLRIGTLYPQSTAVGRQLSRRRRQRISGSGYIITAPLKPDGQKPAFVQPLGVEARTLHPPNDRLKALERKGGILSGLACYWWIDAGTINYLVPCF